VLPLAGPVLVQRGDQIQGEHGQLGRPVGAGLFAMRLLLVGRRLAWQEAETTAAGRRPVLGRPVLAGPALRSMRRVHVSA
jgi:hypothetical protein